MHPRDSHRLTPGTTVWVWVVRLARGRWWPGTVEGLRTIEGNLRVAVRFECRLAVRKNEAPVAAGITSTAMRYVEARNVNSNGIDQPTQAPVSLLECPEEPGSTDNEPVALGASRSSTAKPGLPRIASTSSRTGGNLDGD
jgi:hypothetical protein